MNSERRRVGDAEVEVWRIGSVDKPPLLYLHAEDGLLFSQPLLSALSDDFAVIAPHLPGFGQSTRPPYVKTVRDLALVMVEFVEELGRPITVVGASFGGWVALELALIAPASTSALVLAAPVGIKLGGRTDRDFEDIWMAGFDDLPSIFYGDPERAPDLSQFSDEDLLNLATNQEAVARYGFSPYLHDPGLRHWARRVQCPTLLVSGGTDRFALLPAHYEQFAKVIGTGADHAIIADAGHRIEEEFPQDLAALVVGFVQNHQSATRSSLPA